MAASGEERKSFLYVAITVHLSPKPSCKSAELIDKTCEDDCPQENLFADQIEPIYAVLKVAIVLSSHAYIPVFVSWSIAFCSWFLTNLDGSSASSIFCFGSHRAGSV